MRLKAMCPLGAKMSCPSWFLVRSRGACQVSAIRRGVTPSTGMTSWVSGPRDVSCITAIAMRRKGMKKRGRTY
jgi:hypothetical protein